MQNSQNAKLGGRQAQLTAFGLKNANRYLVCPAQKKPGAGVKFCKIVKGHSGQKVKK